MSKLDLTKTRLEYQPLVSAQMISGGNVGHPRTAESWEQSIEEAEAILADAGFQQSQGPSWYHVNRKIGAVMCNSFGTSAGAKGSVMQGTIGVQLCHEPDPELLLGLVRSRDELAAYRLANGIE